MTFCPPIRAKLRRSRRFAGGQNVVERSKATRNLSTGSRLLAAEERNLCSVLCGCLFRGHTLYNRAKDGEGVSFSIFIHFYSAIFSSTLVGTFSTSFGLLLFFTNTYIAYIGIDTTIFQSPKFPSLDILKAGKCIDIG